MTPIVWNKRDDDDNFKEGEWVEASNIDNASKQNWYNYEQKKWANAQTEDGPFWVWIPRYAYQIENNYRIASETGGKINVVFLEETSDKSNLEIQNFNLGEKPLYEGNKQTNYVVHPAFKFGDEEIPGFWVAKFQASDERTSEDDFDGNYEISMIPNVFPLYQENIKKQYELAFNLRNDPRFGWSGSKVDTHMAKNTEYGAILYLSQSKFGSGKDSTNTLQNGINGGVNYIKNITVSSTHTIYGVYDMAGGPFDRVMANLLTCDENGKCQRTLEEPTEIDLKWGNFEKEILENNKQRIKISGFTQQELDEIPSKYIDEYTGFNDKVFGDGIYEISSDEINKEYNQNKLKTWYTEGGFFLTKSRPWLGRGGCLDLADGNFFYYSNKGCSHCEFPALDYDLYSFRPIALYSEKT